jgi:hypothetical protein
MRATDFLQLQGLDRRAMLQKLDDHGHDPGPIQELEDWAIIRRTCDDEFPDLLYKLLFPQDKARPDPNSVLVLRLMPSNKMITVSALLQLEGSSDDTVEVDWVRLLPWEVLLWSFWQRTTGQPALSFAEWLTSDQSISLVRSVWNAQSRPTSPSQGDVMSVLLAWSQAPGTERLYAERHVSCVESAMSRLLEQGVPLDVLPPLRDASLSDICAALADSPRPIFIVHLIAHGTVGDDGIGRLLFTDEQNQCAVAENAGRLREALRKHQAKHGTIPALWVLNACLSDASAGHLSCASMAQSLAMEGVPYVVASQAAIQVPEMLPFIEAFYTSLGERQPVDKAVLAGRRALLEFHNGPPLSGPERTLPPALATPAGRHLVPLEQGFPTWAVPVLYIRQDCNGYLPGWKPARRIIWPFDGKVMVLVGEGEGSFYIDESPVTTEQFEQVMKGEYASGLESLTLDHARQADDGLPKVSVTPLQAMQYAQSILKRLPTIDQWLTVTRMDARYGADGRYQPQVLTLENFANLDGVGAPLTKVRKYLPQHALGVWDFVGNTFELAWRRADDGTIAYHLVSSSRVNKQPLAHEDPVDSRTCKPDQKNNQIGFRTIVLWQDITALARRFSQTRLVKLEFD